ncbi:MAG: response regulator [Pricia sp.]|nr:response regulator [Pricia sp.]
MKKFDGTCIIDDDAIAIFGLKGAMQALGFVEDIIVFENGLDALEDFEEKMQNGAKLPSLLFIDLNMPVLDGWGFLEEFYKLRQREESMPTIYIMTSSIDQKDMERAKTYNLEHNYLEKPIYAEVLERILA